MEKNKGALSVGRLVSGIISIVLFVIISMQSCAAGISNALEENGEVSGSAGFLLAVCMLVAGIVGIATRNSVSKTGPIVSAVFYYVGALLAYSNAGSYKDLTIWAIVAVLFALIFTASAIKTNKHTKEEE